MSQDKYWFGQKSFAVCQKGLTEREREGRQWLAKREQTENSRHRIENIKAADINLRIIIKKVRQKDCN